jgi:hypothetical protein
MASNATLDRPKVIEVQNVDSSLFKKTTQPQVIGEHKIFVSDQVHNARIR